MKLLNEIINYVLGKKYYVAVLWRRGTDDYLVNSNFIKSKQELENYKRSMEGNLSFQIVEIRSFRSRIDYSHIR